MSKIKNIKSRKILNSKGYWTIEVSVFLEDGSLGVASVPRGESRGATEAVYVDAQKAVDNIKNIERKLVGIDSSNQKELDFFLIELDGTSDKSGLGANVILALSIATVKADANSRKIPTWKRLGEIYGNDSPKFPRLFMNFIEGGLHAGNDLGFQEYLVIPKDNNPEQAIETGRKLYFAVLKKLKKEYGLSSVNVGDEGGFAPAMKENKEPFKFISEVIKTENINGIEFGMDVAANNLELSNEELVLEYENLVKKFPLIYIEDPFSENDFESFAQLNSKLGKEVLIAGDDLTTTNLARMKEAHDKKSINTIIIKPNQIGSITETMEAVSFARKWGWKVVVSHRGGETNDDFIADLSYAVGAFGMKLGGLSRGERMAKYNRLLEIQQ